LKKGEIKYPAVLKIQTNFSMRRDRKKRKFEYPIKIYTILSKSYYFTPIISINKGSIYVEILMPTDLLAICQTLPDNTFHSNFSTDHILSPNILIHSLTGQYTFPQGHSNSVMDVINFDVF